MSPSRHKTIRVGFQTGSGTHLKDRDATKHLLASVALEAQCICAKLIAADPDDVWMVSHRMPDTNTSTSFIVIIPSISELLASVMSSSLSP